MSVELTIRGNVGDTIRLNDVDFRGKKFKALNFSVASTQYKKQMVNGQEELLVERTNWYNCTYWSKDADVLYKNLQKGLPVTVIGSQKIGEYVSKQTGEVLPSYEVRASDVYLNLNSKRIDSIILLPPREPNGTAAPEIADGAPF